MYVLMRVGTCLTSMLRHPSSARIAGWITQCKQRIYSDKISHLSMESQLLLALKQLEKRQEPEYSTSLRSLELLMSSNVKDFPITQNSFVLNVAGRMIPQLADILAPGYKEETCIQFLRVLRGLILLHRPSRQLFKQDSVLQTLLQRGIKHTSSAVQTASIDTLVAAMVRQVEVIRLFEQLSGPKLVCDVFKQSRTDTQVKLAILQFLFFYLVPETRFSDMSRKPLRLTTKEKQAILGKYLSNVDGLVRELETNRPFGSSEIEW